MGGGVGRGGGGLAAFGLFGPPQENVLINSGVTVVAPMNSQKKAALPYAPLLNWASRASVKGTLLGCKLESRGPEQTPRALSITTCCPLFFLPQT